MIPYARQWIDEDDIAAVVDVLRSDWLTTGPKVEEFESALAQIAGTRHAITFSSGTAALHGMMHAINLGPGDEVLVPAMTFAASANCVVYQGGTPVFVDVESDTLLLDVAAAERKITARTRAILAVDYAGQPCDYEAVKALARRHGLAVLVDACHALGGSYHGCPVGSLGLLNAFSFHPAKNATAGEGGAVTTDNPSLAQRMRRFRNHGASSDHRQRQLAGSWFYEIDELGFNYRLTDMQCALGRSQLCKLRQWVLRRQEIAQRYDMAFAGQPAIRPLAVRPGIHHAYHLYVVRLDQSRLTGDRTPIFNALRALGIGVNVHYMPVHLHPFYRRQFGVGPGLCPVAEAAYDEILSLPIFPRMTDEDVTAVSDSVKKVVSEFARRGEEGQPRMHTVQGRRLSR
jgi:perosamine synthetase